jgi:hypothetical protein
MAHRIGAGLEGFAGDGDGGSGQRRLAPVGLSDCGASRLCPLWPSGPGSAQYAWEPPRTVGNTSRSAGRSGTERGGREAQPDFDWASAGPGPDDAQCPERGTIARHTDVDDREESRRDEGAGRLGESGALGNASSGRTRAKEQPRQSHGGERPSQTDVADSKHGTDGTQQRIEPGEEPWRDSPEKQKSVPGGHGEMGNAQGDDERRSSQPAMHREGIKAGGSSVGGQNPEMGDTSGGDGQFAEEAVRHSGTERLEFSGEDMADPARLIGRSGELGEEERIGEDGERRVGPAGGRRWHLESPLGRDADGNPCGVDYAWLCETSDNRIDELRLCGNGVMPDTAERAFRVLWRILTGGVLT